jgi:hypothetical protein
MDLKLVCPERDVFHTSEAITFLYIVGRYLLARGDLEGSDQRLRGRPRAGPGPLDDACV